MLVFFVFSVVIHSAESAGILYNQGWKQYFTASEDPKHWPAYTEQLVSEILSRFDMDNTIHILFTLHQKSNVKLMTTNYAYFSFSPSAVSVPPLKAVLFTVSFSLDMVGDIPWTGVGYAVHFFWSISLSSDLRSLVVFETFQVHGHFKLCGSKLLILHRNMRQSILCGTLSRLHLFMSTSGVLCQIEVFATDLYSFHSLFDMVAAHNVDSDMYLPLRATQLRWQSLFIYSSSTHISSFHVVVKKHKIVSFSGLHPGGAELFDGPGSFSPQVSLLPSAGNITTCTTFQCVLVITQQTALLQNDSLFPYTEYVRVFNKSQFVSNLVELHSIHNLSAGTQSSVFGFHLYTTLNRSHVKFSIRKLFVEGMQHVECLYGGIALIDRRNKTFHEMSNFCGMKNYDLISRQTHFSGTNEMLIVIYGYHSYVSLLQVSGAISATHCKIQKNDLCQMMSTSVHNAVRDLLVTQKVTHSTFYQTVETINLKVRFSGCIIVQLNGNLPCSIAIATKIPKFSMKVFLERSVDLSQNYEHLKYKISGVLCSMGIFGYQKIYSILESFFAVDRVQLNASDSQFTVVKGTEHHKRLLFHLKNNEDSSSDLLKIQPPYKASLLYSLSFHVPYLHLSLKQVMWGVYGWTTVQIIPVRRTAAAEDKISICDSPQALLAIHPNTALVLSVDESAVSNKNLMLSVEVVLQVSAVYFCFSKIFLEQRSRMKLLVFSIKATDECEICCQERGMPPRVTECFETRSRYCVLF